MPYASIAAAKAAGTKTNLKGAELTLAQINGIAAAADAIKKKGSAENPYAVAVAQFQKTHKIEDGKWVKKKAGGTRELEDGERELADLLVAAYEDGGHSDLELESSPPGTRTVPGVTVLKEGVHVDRHRNTLVVTPESLQAIPEGYKRLIQLGFRPPVTLTHDRNHPLASGYPSLGWPDVPRAFIDEADGLWTLESDFLGVPVKFADIMEAGGYDNVSAGLFQNVKVGDFLAPLAIDHVAVLGTSHPAVRMKGISDIHKLYEHEMANIVGVEVSTAYLFEAGDFVSQDKEGGPMPLTAEQLAEYGVANEAELKAKLSAAGRVEAAEKTAETRKIELEAANTQIRVGAANGFIAMNRDKFPPALDDSMRALHMAVTRDATPVEFERPTKDGSVETVKLDPVASLTAIVAKFGKAIELEEENAPEGGIDQEHMTDEEKKAAKLAAEKAAEKKDGDDTKVEGKTDEVVELSSGAGLIGRSMMARDQNTLAKFIADRDGINIGIAMGVAAVELERAGYGTDAYIPPDGLEEKKDTKDKK
jgi:hypothetical protein